MNKYKSKLQKRIRRHKRVRAKISGTIDNPRLCVFRSNKNIYAQIIDDKSAKTIVSSGSTELKGKKGGNTASEVGRLISEKAIAKGIKKVRFDRGGYAYHGNIKKLAEAARKGGLIF